jgi:hypothetical protein
MKMSRMFFAGVMLLLLNPAVLSFGQQDKKDDEAKPAQQENKPSDLKPAESKPDHRAQEDKRSQEMRNKEDKDQKKNANDETSRAEQGKNKASQDDHNRGIASAQERGGARSRQRIPDDKFRAHFGREHRFRPSRPVIVENRPRIQYGGYAFEFVDAWPVGWSYDDDCYIDYIDGEYFLFDVLHPGVRIALVVVF